MADTGHTHSDAVVLHIRSGSANPMALEAAARLAQAMRSEFESLFVEDDELLSLSELPFAREISPTGRRRRTLSSEDVRREMQSRSRSVRRDIEQIARNANIRCHFSAVRASADTALSRASEKARVLVFGDSIGNEAHIRTPTLTRCFGTVEACLVLGSRVRRTTGPVVIALDEIANLPSMANLAEHWIAGKSDEVIVTLLGSALASRSEILHRIDSVISTDRQVRVRTVTHDQAGRAISDISASSRAGLVIARQGGPLAPDDIRLARVITALECPLLLHRGN